MQEAQVRIGERNQSLRLLLRHMNGGRGLGLGQISFTFELSALGRLEENLPIWLGGQLYAAQLGAMSGVLAPLVANMQPVTVVADGGQPNVTLTANIDHRQLQIIEDARVGGLTFRLDVSGHYLKGQEPFPIWTNVEQPVTQGEWITLLEQFGYKRLVLIELDAPDPNRAPQMAQAIEFYRQAEKHFQQQEWRLTVESLRQSLAVLVGKKPEDEDSEAEVRAAMKAVRSSESKQATGYAPRWEPVRVAMKFLCDLGAHPEVTETLKPQAYSALLMVAGLLHGYEKTPAVAPAPTAAPEASNAAASAEAQVSDAVPSPQEIHSKPTA